jgi:hypothetical protein
MPRRIPFSTPQRFVNPRATKSNFQCVRVEYAFVTIARLTFPIFMFLVLWDILRARRLQSAAEAVLAHGLSHSPPHRPAYSLHHPPAIPKNKSVLLESSKAADLLPRRSAQWRAARGSPPAWCAKLKEEPRPSQAVPQMPKHLKRCGRRTDSGECYDGTTITFFSQHHQGTQRSASYKNLISGTFYVLTLCVFVFMKIDAYLYLKHFKALSRPGVYLDIAANHPIEISNTFFMDRCLHWKGLCAEANPKYFSGLTSLRSCELIPTCVSKSEEEALFRLSGAGTSSLVWTNSKQFSYFTARLAPLTQTYELVYL